MSTEARKPYYSLVYRHGVDDKRRLSIPAAWREGGEELTFYLMLWDPGGQPPSLMALPPEAMETMQQRIEERPFFDREMETLQRWLGSHSARVTVDKAGRISLPEPLARDAGITSEAVLVGLMSRFQVWKPEYYPAIQTADHATKDRVHKV
jgi:MraZ protein